MIVATIRDKDAKPFRNASCWHRSLMDRVREGLRSFGRHLGQPNAANLKDLGLSVSDLPAIRAGLIAQDSSRRQR